MKNIIFFLAFFLALQANAQQNKVGKISTRHSGKTLISNLNEFAEFNNNKQQWRGLTQYYSWLNFLTLFEGISTTQINNATFAYPLFPDSSVRYGAPDTNIGIGFNSIGQVLHPQSYVINAGLGAGQFSIGSQPYIIDSVYLLASYNKISAAVDTLIVSLVYSSMDNLQVEYFTGQQATNYQTDTVRMAIMEYAPNLYLNAPIQTHGAGGPLAKVIKYALTNADSSFSTNTIDGYRMKNIAVETNFAVPAGQIVGVSFTFKPGYMYNAGDTLKNNNYFYFASTQPNGMGTNNQGTYMPYFKGDFNMCSVVTKDSSNSFGKYMPTVAFTDQNFSAELHHISYLLSCPTCFSGVNDIPKLDGVTIYPNPSNGRITITSVDDLLHKKMNLSIYDFVGKVCYQETFINNKNHKSIDLHPIAAGIYQYTISMNDKAANGKLIITD